MVGRYAVHCEGVAFSCKKHGDFSSGIAVSASATTMDRIRQIHSSAVANEIIKFEVSSKKWGFKASGWTSNANYHVKKTTILLFINHRSVESSAVKKAIQSTYSPFLPKGGHPFIYLSLEIDPKRVDVNVHPTKREVNFLNEDEIVDTICDHIRTELSKVDTSRTFMTQSLLPNVSGLSATPARTSKAPIQTPKSAPRPADNNLVRTDPSIRKITSMLPKSARAEGKGSQPEFDYTITDRSHMQIRLTTVKALRTQVRAAIHQGLTEVFTTHVYVGLVDTLRRIIAIQSGVKLYLVDYGMICNEYFYQIGLTDFANFGSITFTEPLDIRSLIQIAANEESKAPGPAIDFAKIPGAVTSTLVDRREMLKEYFSLEISEDGKLLGIPLLVKGYMPSMAKLPRFLMRLGPCVNWTEEEKCFHTLLTELATFYTPEQLPNPPATFSPNDASGGTQDPEGTPAAEEDEEVKSRRGQMEYMLEHVLFPAIRSRLVATKGLLKGVVEVADLKGLYKVFERC